VVLFCLIVGVSLSFFGRW